MYVCLGVNCHLHFWQKEPGSLTYHCGNTWVERTPNKSRHTKLTPEKKIFPPLLPGFELATFRSRVRRSNQQAIPAPPTSYPDSTNKLSRLYQQAIPTLPTSYPGSTNKLSRLYQQAIPTLPASCPDSTNKLSRLPKLTCTSWDRNRRWPIWV